MIPDNESLTDGSDADQKLDHLDAFLRDLFQSRKNVDSIASQSRTQENTDLKLLEKGVRIGRFTIRGCLGCGGYGVIYHAVDEHLGLEVALKMLRPDRLKSKRALMRFQREARLADGLQHHSVVRLIESSIEGDTVFIANEFQNGLNLREWLDANNGQVSVGLVVKWGIQLADALQYLFQRGVVHRDLKPSNIMIVPSGWMERAGSSGMPDWTPKITDFGLAYSIIEQDASELPSGWMLGTPGYIAPEQLFTPHIRVDIRGDIYALGMILAELLAGERIHKFTRSKEFLKHLMKRESSRDLDLLRYKVPFDLLSILNKSVELDPKKRYQTPEELQHDLLRFQEGKSVSARRSGLRARVSKIFNIRQLFMEM